MEENYIIQKKLLFLHHLLSLPNDSLAKEILKKQKENGWPGLYLECQNHLEEIELEEDPTLLSKNQWKKLVKEKVHVKNKNDLLEEVKKYKKLSHEKWMTEEYGIKSYLINMSLQQARTLFSIRAEVLPTIQMNFKNKPEYVQNLWKCKCGEDDVQSHLIYCRSYEHLREGLNLEESEKDLVYFYQKVVRERENEIL